MRRAAGLGPLLWFVGAGLCWPAEVAGGAPSGPPALLLSVEAESVFAARVPGLVGLAAEPACRSVGDGLALCLVIREGAGGRRLSLADLAGWGLTLFEAERAARASAELAWEAHPAEVSSVEGMKGRYWLRMEGDGADGAAPLLPERLATAAGGSPVVAFPQHGVVLFWLPGDADFDRVMAVGVKRMAEAAAEPVSGRVYRWSGGRWEVWGEARPPAGGGSPPG